MKKAIFAGGCFWHVEDVLRQVNGVTATRVGYTGGTTPGPTYEQVCSHTTGHAEAVEVTYDPSVVTFEDLLEVFWSAHDPTQLNRQGPDQGTQYRSAIFALDEGQLEAAEKSKERLEMEGRFLRAIVTQIVPAPEFYEAEEYHQQYYEKHGISSCGI